MWKVSATCEERSFRSSTLRRLFGLDPKPTDADTRTIVVNVGERTMGCTVDAVSQVIRIPEESIQPAPETVTADGATYISGFAKLGERLVILLDIDELLNPERLERHRKSEPPRNAAIALTETAISNT